MTATQLPEGSAVAPAMPTRGATATPAMLRRPLSRPPGIVLPEVLRMGHATSCGRAGNRCYMHRLPLA